MEATIEKEMTTRDVIREVESFMDQYYGYEKTGNGLGYSFEIYVDYRDEISDRTIKNAIQNEEKHRKKGELPDYRQALYEEMDDWYFDAVNYGVQDLISEIRNHFEYKSVEAEEAFDNHRDAIMDWIHENCEWHFPESLFNRDVQVNIMVDTGNWNYDCTKDNVLNYASNMYRETDEEDEIEIPEESSLLWLAKQQGYEDELRDAVRKSKAYDEIVAEMNDEKIKKREEIMRVSTELYEAAFNMSIEARRIILDQSLSLSKQLEPEVERASAKIEEKYADRLAELKPKNKFVMSCIREWENLSSHMATLTFLTTMPLMDFLELKRKVNGRIDLQRDKRGYGVKTESDLKTETESEDKIVIDKSVMCGLFAPWEGGGSILEVECEKDVEIPLNVLFDVSMDGEKTYGYDVDEVYGLIESCWDAKVELKFAE